MRFEEYFFFFFLKEACFETNQSRNFTKKKNSLIKDSNHVTSRGINHRRQIIICRDKQIIFADIQGSSDNEASQLTEREKYEKIVKHPQQ